MPETTQDDISEWLTSLRTFGAKPFPTVVEIRGKGFEPLIPVRRP